MKHNKDANFFKLMCRFNSYQNLSNFLLNIHELILKLRKNNKVGEIPLPAVKAHHIAAVSITSSGRRTDTRSMK